MKIETYTNQYYDDVVDLVENFYKEAIQLYDPGFDKQALARAIANLKENNRGNAFLLIVDGKCEGILAGIELPSFLNNKRTFTEIIWYVNEKHRRYGVVLLNKAQDYLRSHGFNSMIMGVLEDSKPEKVKALYERMGYKKFQTDYIRSL